MKRTAQEQREPVPVVFKADGAKGCLGKRPDSMSVHKHAQTLSLAL
jgi:hypothetical protein